MYKYTGDEFRLRDKLLFEFKAIHADKTFKEAEEFFISCKGLLDNTLLKDYYWFIRPDREKRATLREAVDMFFASFRDFPNDTEKIFGYYYTKLKDVTLKEVISGECIKLILEEIEAKKPKKEEEYEN